MKKTVQFLVFVLSIGILVSYQNCSQVPSGFGEFNSFDSDSGNQSSVGYFYLAPNVLTANDETTTLTINGGCSQGKARNTRIEWNFSPSYTYVGQRSGVEEGQCNNNYFSFNVNLDRSSSGGFNHNTTNYFYLTFIVTDSQGEEFRKTYDVLVGQGTTRETDDRGDCPNYNRTGGECIIGDGPLDLNSLGYAGLAVSGKVTYNGTMDASAGRYPMIHLLDVNNEAYMGITVGSYSNNNDKFVNTELRFFPEKFGQPIYRETYKGVLQKSPGSDDKDLERGYISGQTYYFEYRQHFRAYIDPVTGIPFFASAYFRICDSSTLSNCSTQYHKASTGMVFPLKPFGYNGMKLVFGHSASLGDTPNQEDYKTNNNWYFRDIEYRLCGSSRRYSPVENDGFCDLD